jgi:hypothetical protein
MKARGKREARRPWFMQYELSGLKGRNICSIARFQGYRALNCVIQGRRALLRFALAPWLLYLAPLALEAMPCDIPKLNYLSRAEVLSIRLHSCFVKRFSLYPHTLMKRAAIMVSV